MSTHGSVKSSSSIGRSVREEVVRLLASVSDEATNGRGQSGVFISLKDVEHLTDQIEKLKSGKNTNMSPAEILKLRHEIDTLRYEKNIYRDRADEVKQKMAFLSTDIEVLKASKEAQDELVTQLRKRVEEEKKILIEDLNAAKQVNSDLKKQIVISKKEKDSEENLKSMEATQAAAANKITELNNKLQSVNNTLAEEMQKSKRLGDKVLQLSTDLNYHKARRSSEPTAQTPVTPVFKKTFADVTKEADKANPGGVTFLNVLNVSLTPKSKEALQAYSQTSPDDVRQRAYSLMIAATNTPSKLLWSYKKILVPFFRDLKDMSYPSRKNFIPFLDAVYESFLPKGQRLTEKQLNEMLTSIESEKIKYKKKKPASSTASKSKVRKGKEKMDETITSLKHIEPGESAIDSSSETSVETKIYRGSVAWNEWFYERLELYSKATKESLPDWLRGVIRKKGRAEYFFKTSECTTSWRHIWRLRFWVPVWRCCDKVSSWIKTINPFV